MVERKHKLFFKNNIFYLIILYKKIKNKIKKKQVNCSGRAWMTQKVWAFLKSPCAVGLSTKTRATELFFLRDMQLFLLKKWQTMHPLLL
jgi:hypothetical protein